MATLKLTKDERELVVKHAREAAVAMANFWDALRTVETAHDVEFDNTVDMIETLAADCDAPAQGKDISKTSILTLLQDCVQDEESR